MICTRAQERGVLIKEQKNRYYPLSAYLAAKTFLDVCTTVFTTFFYCLITYLMIGFNLTANQFWCVR